MKQTSSFQPPALTSIEKQGSVHNLNEQCSRHLPFLDSIAVFVTKYVGTMGFFGVILAWSVLWIGWNLLAPSRLQFDPPMGFVLWLFISNFIQILLMPLIMVGQNVQGAYAEARAELDLEIDTKAGREIEIILRHVEDQNQVLQDILKRIEGLPLPLDGTQAISKEKS